MSRTKRIKELTSAQTARFPEFVERWVAYGLSTAPADRLAAEWWMARAYARGGQSPPRRIVWCTSPLALVLTDAAIQSLLSVGDSVRDSVRASVRDSVRASVRDSVRASVRDSVWASVRVAVGDSVWAAVYASVEASVLDAVWVFVGNSVGAAVRVAVGDSVGDSVWASVRASVRASVGASVRASVGASVRDSVWASVRDSVWASVRDSVGASVRDSVGASVRDSVWASVRDSVGDSVRASVRASVYASVGDAVGDSVGDSVRASVADSVRDSVGDSVWAAVWDSVGDSVRASVADSVRDSVGDSVWASVYASVGDSVWVSVRDSVWASVRVAVGDSVWAAVGDSVGDSVRASVGASVRASVNSFWESGWLAFYAYLREVCCLTVCEQLDGLSGLHQTSGWWLARQGVAYLSERPVVLRRDARGQLHCPDGPALAYPDGWGLYAWHGMRVPARVIEQPASLTTAEVLSEQNVEVRRVMIERMGAEAFIRSAHAEQLQRDDWGTLWRVPLADDEPLVIVQVVNATPEADGHFKDYFLRVPPQCRTAQQAVAWTFESEAGDYAPTVQT